MTVTTIAFACIVSGFAAAAYIYSLKMGFKDPTTGVRVEKIVAMVIDCLATLLSIATAHAVQLKSKKIGFRLFTFFTLGGCGLDLTYFVYLCKTSGFDAVCDKSSSCSAKSFLIAFSVFIFIAVLIRSYAVLVLWHYDIRWDQGKISNNAPVAPVTTASSSSASTPAAPAATPAAPAPASTSAAAPPAFNPPSTPVAQYATYSSLPKFLGGKGRRGKKGVPTIAVSRASEDEDEEEKALFAKRGGAVGKGKAGAEYYELSDLEDDDDDESDTEGSSQEERRGRSGFGRKAVPRKKDAGKYDRV